MFLASLLSVGCKPQVAGESEVKYLQAKGSDTVTHMMLSGKRGSDYFCIYDISVSRLKAGTSSNNTQKKPYYELNPVKPRYDLGLDVETVYKQLKNGQRTDSDYQRREDLLKSLHDTPWWQLLTDSAKKENSRGQSAIVNQQREADRKREEYKSLTFLVRADSEGTDGKNLVVLASNEQVKLLDKELAAAYNDIKNDVPRRHSCLTSDKQKDF